MRGSWFEFYDCEETERIAAIVQEWRGQNISVRPNGRAALAQVQRVKEIGARHRKKLRVRHEPFAESLSYAQIRGVNENDLSLLEELGSPSGLEASSLRLGLIRLIASRAITPADDHPLWSFAIALWSGSTNRFGGHIEMTDEKAHIWDPENGITGLPETWKSLEASEIASIQKIWAEQRERLQGTKQLNEFSERLGREWAIETGVIENLYDIDRGVTETLIEHGFRSELLSQNSTNKPREFVLQLIRDQKDALDGVFDFVSKRRQLSTSYIKELHSALLRSQTYTEAIDLLGRPAEVEVLLGAWKTQPNYPTRDDTTYVYCPPEQVSSEMDRLVDWHLQHREAGVGPEVQAAWLHHRFTQIYPFQDGNGRVARALASLVLVQAGLFPLVVTRDERVEYIDSLEAADLGDLAALVRLIARLQRVQFRRATAISEDILSVQDDVQQVLGGLLNAAERHEEQRTKALQRVFDYADALQRDIDQRFTEIIPTIITALQRVTPSASVFMTRSDDFTSHYFRSQIIENAKYHLHYYADTSGYRTWVSLNMNWQRRAKLVFAFHGIGRPFSGSLVCAPFLEFRDADDEGQTRATLVPLADEPFVFFYNETEERAVSRFRPWRERILTIAVKELSQNL